MLLAYGYPAYKCNIIAFTQLFIYQHATAINLVNKGYLNKFTLPMYYQLDRVLNKLKYDKDKLFTRSNIIPVLSFAVRTKQINHFMIELILLYCTKYSYEEIIKIVENAVFNKIICAPIKLN